MAALFAFAVAAAAGVAYVGTSFHGGGTIAGRITYNGQPPARAKLSILTDRQYCGATREDDSWLVGADGGVKNVIVFLSDITTGKKMEADPTLVLNQVGCHYTPRVSIVPLGARMEVKSADPVLHNVHTYLDGSTLINFAIPPRQNFTLSRKLDKPGGMKLKCDVHPFMRGVIFVATNPYAVITGDDGSFEIPDVPPGTYTINTWHEMAGGVSQRVTVPDGGKVVWNAKVK